MFKQFVAGVGILVILGGGGFVAETYAGQQQSNRVRTAVQQLFPDAEITRVEPHGRPFVLARFGASEVSSAYVDVAGPSGPTQLILKNVSRDDGKIGSLLWFSPVSPPTALEPVLTSDGIPTAEATARVQGEPVTVTYAATVSAGTLCVRPSIVRSGSAARPRAVPAGWAAALTPEPVRVPTTVGLTVRAVTVRADGITVELQARDADSTHRAAETSTAGTSSCRGPVD